MNTLAASFVVAIGNSLQASGAPFPVFAIGFLFIGFGAAFLVSLLLKLSIICQVTNYLISTASCIGCWV